MTLLDSGPMCQLADWASGFPAGQLWPRPQGAPTERLGCQSPTVGPGEGAQSAEAGLKRLLPSRTDSPTTLPEERHTGLERGR